MAAEFKGSYSIKVFKKLDVDALGMDVCLADSLEKKTINQDNLVTNYWSESFNRLASTSYTRPGNCYLFVSENALDPARTYKYDYGNHGDLNPYDLGGSLTASIDLANKKFTFQRTINAPSQARTVRTVGISAYNYAYNYNGEYTMERHYGNSMCSVIELTNPLALTTEDILYIKYTCYYKFTDTENPVRGKLQEHCLIHNPSDPSKSYAYEQDKWVLSVYLPHDNLANVCYGPDSSIGTYSLYAKNSQDYNDFTDTTKINLVWSNKLFRKVGALTTSQYASVMGSHLLVKQPYDNNEFVMGSGVKWKNIHAPTTDKTCVGNISAYNSVIPRVLAPKVAPIISSVHKVRDGAITAWHLSSSNPSSILGGVTASGTPTTSYITKPTFRITKAGDACDVYDFTGTFVGSDQIQVPNGFFTEATGVVQVKALQTVGNLVQDTIYYCIKDSETLIRVAASEADALASTAITLPASGSIDLIRESTAIASLISHYATLHMGHAMPFKDENGQPHQMICRQGPGFDHLTPPNIWVWMDHDDVNGIMYMGVRAEAPPQNGSNVPSDNKMFLCTWKTFSIESALTLTRIDDQLCGAYKNGKVYVGTYLDGLKIYDVVAKATTVIDLEGPVAAIKEDPETGMLWAAVHRKGIVKIDPSNDSVTKIYVDNGSALDGVNADLLAMSKGSITISGNLIVVGGNVPWTHNTSSGSSVTTSTAEYGQYANIIVYDKVKDMYYNLTPADVGLSTIGRLGFSDTSSASIVVCPELPTYNPGTSNISNAGIAIVDVNIDITSNSVASVSYTVLDSSFQKSHPTGITDMSQFDFFAVSSLSYRNGSVNLQLAVDLYYSSYSNYKVRAGTFIKDIESGLSSTYDTYYYGFTGSSSALAARNVGNPAPRIASALIDISTPEIALRYSVLNSCEELWVQGTPYFRRGANLHPTSHCIYKGPVRKNHPYTFNGVNWQFSNLGGTPIADQFPANGVISTLMGNLRVKTNLQTANMETFFWNNDTQQVSHEITVPAEYLIPEKTSDPRYWFVDYVTWSCKVTESGTPFTRVNSTPANAGEFWLDYSNNKFVFHADDIGKTVTVEYIYGQKLPD